MREYPLLYDSVNTETTKDYFRNNNVWKAVAASNFLHPKSVSTYICDVVACITQPAYTLDVINIHAFKTQKTVEVVHRVCDAFFLFALRALLACIALRCVRLRLRLRLTALRALVGWLGTRLQ